MAILVDDLREYPDVALPFTTWCHMATDGDLEELHAFAARLGLQRRWFQRDHYDLPPHGRRAAVALGAEEVATGELLRRMTGPRGDRARRRALAPAGVVRLRGGGGPAVLRYPAGALVVIAGPGGSALAARAVDSARVPVLDDDGPDALGAVLGSRDGAVVISSAPGLALPEAAAVAGVTAHLVLLEQAIEPQAFASVAILDRAAADRIRRIVISPSGRA